MDFNAYNFQSGQFKRMFSKHFDHVCDSLYVPTFKTYFENYQAHMTAPVPWNECPYPAGKNQITNYVLTDPDALLPPYVPGGENWKIEIKLFRDEVLLGGWNVLSFY